MIDAEIAIAAGEAATALARWDASLTREDDATSALRGALILAEALATAHLNGTSVSCRSLAAHRIGVTTRSRHAHDVAHWVDALGAAEQTSDVPTVADATSTDGPRWRTEPCGDLGTPPRSSFMPPSPARIAALVDDWNRFMDRTDVAPFVQVAIGHAQLLSIRPFGAHDLHAADTLTQWALRAYGVTLSVSAPLALGRLAYAQSWETALDAYRTGSLDALIEVSTRMGFAGVNQADSLTTSLRAWLVDVASLLTQRQDAAVHRLLPTLIGQPVITANHVAHTCGVTFHAAQTAIRQLEAAGVVEPMGESRRNRAWTTSGVTRIIDAALL